MAYVKTNWEDYPSTATAIDADALNHMEEGIYNNDQALGGKLDNVSPSFSGNMTGSGNVTVGGEVENGNGETLHGAYQSAENVLPIDTESGNPTVITDAFGGACKSLKLTLEPIQSGSGTPSPSNVRPISGLTEANVVRTGKNLLPQLCDAGTKASVTLTKNSDGSYTMSGSPSANNQFQSVAKLKLFPGTYIWRASADGTSDIGSDANGYAYLMGVNGSGEWIRSYGTSTLTVTVESEITLGFAWHNASSLNITFYPMIRPSSIADTTFEAYNGATYTVDLDGTRYGGTVDFKTGVLSVSHLLVEYDGSEDETWTMYGTGSASAYAVIGRLPSVAEFTPNVLGVLTASYLENVSAQATWGNYNYFISQSNAMTGIDFVMGLKNISTSVNALKTYLAEHPLTICYKLATPITVQLTAEEVTLLRLNNVLTANGSNISVSYSADVQAYIDKKIAEGSQGNRSVDNSSLTKGGSGDEELKEEEKKEEIEIKEAEPLTKEVR